jgi:thiol-disulfide isomerase/thioredoxin
VLTPALFSLGLSVLWISVVPALSMALSPAPALAGSDPTEAAPQSAARPAPAFSLPTPDGRLVSLDSLRGKVVLLDFWASWCGPCARSFPWLSSLRARYAGKPFEIVGVNLDKKRAAADAFLADHPVPFVIAFDPSGETAEAFQVSAMPTTIVLGPAGNILYKHTGFDPKKTGPLEAVIEKEVSR